MPFNFWLLMQLISFRSDKLRVSNNLRLSEVFPRSGRLRTVGSHEFVIPSFALNLAFEAEIQSKARNDKQLNGASTP